MSTEIIELRQQDGYTPDDLQPADYEVKLQKPVVINDGDVVSVKAAFLDTEASSEQKIVIEDDLNLHFECGYYQVLSRKDNMDISNGGANGYATGPAAYVDGKTYLLMQNKGAAGDYLQGINIQEDTDKYSWCPVERFNNPNGGPDFVQMLVTLEYYAPGAGATTTTTVDLSTLTWDTNDGTFQYNTNTDVTQIVYDKAKQVPGSTSPVVFNAMSIKSWSNGFAGPPNNQKLQLYNGGATAIYAFNDRNGAVYKADFSFIGDTSNPPTPAAAQTQLFTTNSNITNTPVLVPAGDYTPQDLSTVINRQLQQDVPNAGAVLDSQFLLKYNRTDYPDTLWIAEDRSAAFETTDPLDAAMNGGLLIGATQMVLDYDADRQRFFWSYLHSPYLGSQNQAVFTESVGFIPKDNTVAGVGDPVLIRRNAGIFFTQLSATNSAGANVSFWDGTLGFDLSTLLVGTNNYGATNINALNLNDLYMPVSIPINECTTAGYAGLDILADRTTSPAVWWHMPDTKVPSFTTTNGITEEIFAGKGVQTRVDGFGYYLLDIEAQMGQDYVGANNLFRSIRAIVSRYYENDSFTAASEADSIPYVHKGQPLYVNSFRVRILQDDKTLAPNLGNRSTVMMQVQRPM